MSELKCKDNYNWLLHLHYVRGEYNQLERFIDNLAIKSSYSYYLQGLIALRSSASVQEALKMFDKIASLSNLEAISDLYHIKAVARCYLLLGQHQKVIELIRENGLKYYPNDWQLWSMLGNCFLHSQNISQAKNAFQHAITNSTQIEPFLHLANCCMIDGDYKTAIFVLRKASDIAPENIAVAIRLGQILMENMRSKGIDKFMQLNQMTANCRGNLGLSLAVGSILQEFRNDIDGALCRYQMADNFNSPSIWNNIGLCFAQRNQFQSAIICLRKALYLNPIDFTINYNLGLCFLHLKQFASAFHHLKASCSYHKHSADVFSLIAVSLQHLDDDFNSKQAHLAATKSSLSVTPLAIVNFAIYLYKKKGEPQSGEKNNCYDEMITELIMEVEKIWLDKRKKNEFIDDFIMKSAIQLASQLNIEHIAWNNRADDEVDNQEAIQSIQDSTLEENVSGESEIFADDQLTTQSNSRGLIWQSSEC